MAAHSVGRSAVARQTRSEKLSESLHGGKGGVGVREGVRHKHMRREMQERCPGLVRGALTISERAIRSWDRAARLADVPRQARCRAHQHRAKLGSPVATHRFSNALKEAALCPHSWFSEQPVR